MDNDATIEGAIQQAETYGEAVVAAVGMFERIKRALPEEASDERLLCDRLSSCVVGLLADATAINSQILHLSRLAV